MLRLAIQINYTDANPDFFAWLKAAIPPKLVPLGIDSVVYLANGPTPRPVDSFDNFSLYHFGQAMINNSSVRQQAEQNGDWYVHVLITTHHVDGHLGLMYDFGFDERYRQGCVVFAGQIRSQVTGPQTNDFQRVVLRTVLHEIGHCLNFIHHSDLMLMTQTGELSKRLGENWINKINYQYSEEDINYIGRYPSSSRPGGDTSNVGGIIADNIIFNKNKIAITVKPFTDKLGSEFELGGTVSLIIKIRNKSEKRATLTSPLDKNGEHYKIWLTAPGKKERQIKRAVQGCGIASKNIYIKPNSFKHFPLHLFADSEGYLFSNPGKYKMVVAIKQNSTTWIKSRAISILIKDLPKTRTILKKTVNSADVLKYMLLGKSNKRTTKLKIRKAVKTNKSSEFNRAIQWNEFYEIKSDLKIAPDTVTTDKLNKQLLKLFDTLINSETSKVRKGKIAEESQKAALSLGRKPVLLQGDDIKNIRKYKKFETFLIKREK